MGSTVLVGQMLSCHAVRMHSVLMLQSVGFLATLGCNSVAAAVKFHLISLHQTWHPDTDRQSQLSPCSVDERVQC